MPKKIPKTKKTPRQPDHWFISGVGSYAQEAQSLILYGLDWNNSGPAGIVERELDRQKVWTKIRTAMRNGRHADDALVDIHVVSSDQAFMLGVAYGLLVDRRLFEKTGGVR